MPKHKTRNTFYWRTCKKTQSVNKIWLVYLILQEKFLSKDSTKTAIWNLVPGPVVFAKNLAQPLLENEIFEAIGSY